MKLCKEYCAVSTLHGLRYFVEKKRHWLERLWWIFAFLLALACCVALILQVYFKWRDNPVIEGFASKSTTIWDIPFPAVTICPETKVTGKLNFSEIFLIMASTGKSPFNISDEEEELMDAILQICEPHLTEGIALVQNFTNSSIIDLLKDNAPSFNDTMFICKFRNAINYCDEYFSEFITDEGLCFTFNMLNGSELYTENMSPDYSPFNDVPLSAKHWNLGNGYNSNVRDHKAYPYSVSKSGTRAGLFVMLKLYEQHLDYVCRGPVQGFKVLFHTPGEIPQVSKHYFKVALLQEVLLAVKPSMITTSDGLRRHEPNKRQCYFESERRLRYLKVYTQRNCELECLSNFTLRYCGCVKFSMPRDKNTPICGAEKIYCYNEAEDICEDNLLKEQYRDSLSPESVLDCNCLPACTSITYDADISTNAFDWVSLFNAYKSPLEEFPGMQPTRLAIFFKENQFITSKRSELYGFTDFLATCGGLLGLFIGASFLSIVELLYFFSLRLCCNLGALVKQKPKKCRSTVVPEVTVVKAIVDSRKCE